MNQLDSQFKDLMKRKNILTALMFAWSLYGVLTVCLMLVVIMGV